MRGQDLRQHLAAGKRAYGILLEGFGHPRWPRLLSVMGIDFVFLDNEHNPLDRETCAWAAQAYSAYGIAPLLRIPEPSPTLAAMALDAGAHGIIVPYVETAEQVRQMAGAVKYRPLKGAALHQALEAGGRLDEHTIAYLNRYNPDALLVVMIESPAGVANLPELLAVPGVDVVLVGPHDLSVSHGVPEDFDSPVFERAVQDVIRVCRERGVAVGVHHLAGSSARLRRWIEWGCNWITYKSDTALLVEGIVNEMGALRESLGDGSRPSDLPFPFGTSSGGPVT